MILFVSGLWIMLLVKMSLCLDREGLLIIRIGIFRIYRNIEREFIIDN